MRNGHRWNPDQSDSSRNILEGSSGVKATRSFLGQLGVRLLSIQRYIEVRAHRPPVLVTNIDEMLATYKNQRYF